MTMLESDVHTLFIAFENPSRSILSSKLLSRNPKFFPNTVTEMLPVAGAFMGEMEESDGTSNEKNLVPAAVRPSIFRERVSWDPYPSGTRRWRAV